MPGSRGEITVGEHNGVDNDHNRRKKKEEEEEEDGIESENQLVMPSISKPRKRFIDKFRKRPKSPKRSSSRSGSRKGGCFSLRRRRRRTEEGEEEEDSSTVSDPNDECFTHEMLRVMLETNDFCSNECNPHRRKLSGTSVLLRYVGRSATSLPGFYGSDAFESSQIDEWVDYATVFSSGSEFENACTRVDTTLRVVLTFSLAILCPLQTLLSGQLLLVNEYSLSCYDEPVVAY
ncbi:unnamed protein product [Brassica rapa]|uniref:Uncharacterized protein n=1 Tax=Brassica campestris TaxID=3711 RepID=A0A8D9G7P9_BRACM|nr:unnamed protein product [Brassica rapa]